MFLNKTFDNKNNKFSLYNYNKTASFVRRQCQIFSKNGQYIYIYIYIYGFLWFPPIHICGVLKQT